MSNAMQRQIDRLKTDIDQIKPKPETLVMVLIEPGPDADAETIAAYLAQLAQAKRCDSKVIVVRFMDGKRLERENVDGVTYVRNEWEAQMLQLSGQQSERGNTNRLDDVLKGLSGNVMGAVANPPGDVHAGWLGRQVADDGDD